MSDWLFYFFSKSIGFLLHIDKLLIITALAGLLTSWKWRKISQILLITSISSLLIICFFPVGSLLIKPLEKRFPAPPTLPEHIAGIIVLGGSARVTYSAFHQAGQFGESAERVMVLPALMKKYPESALIITSGIKSSIDNSTEANVIYQWLKPLVPNTTRIYIENKAKNTYQNALYSISYKEKENAELPWLLVTSAAHMPRSVSVFRAFDWNIIPYPVDFHSAPVIYYPYFLYNMQVLSSAWHEWLGLFSYYLNGYTEELFPKPITE